MENDTVENRGLLLNFAIDALGSPGIVTDSKTARESSCKCYTFKGKPKICFSKGVVGALSKPQIKHFCNPLIDLGESKRVKAFVEAAKKARKKKDLESWVEAMASELKSRDIEI